MKWKGNTRGVRGQAGWGPIPKGLWRRIGYYVIYSGGGRYKKVCIREEGIRGVGAVL